MSVRDHTALLSDYFWSESAAYGRTVVTYARPASLPDYVKREDSLTDPNFFDSFSPVRDAAADTFREAMKIWESVGNIQLVEVSPGRTADIQAGLYEFDILSFNTIGAAYFPNDFWKLGGDIFIDEDYATNLDLWLHETGHALGLAHPHEGVILDPAIDNTTATVMSYNGYDTGGLGYLDDDALAAMYGGRIVRDVIVSEYEIRTAPAKEVFSRLRDFDGNDLGGDGAWRLIGNTDTDGDGDRNLIAVNDTLGRWASLGLGDDGLIDFSDHGTGGDTRVVGVYLDPLVQNGTVKAGSDFDSQSRFTNDLKIGNLATVVSEGDFDGDGLQELYFSLTDETAFLHAYMHADGNIRYANYQSEDQVASFLDANGVNGYDAWLYA